MSSVGEILPPRSVQIYIVITIVITALQAAWWLCNADDRLVSPAPGSSEARRCVLSLLELAADVLDLCML